MRPDSSEGDFQAIRRHPRRAIDALLFAHHPLGHYPRNDTGMWGGRATVAEGKHEDEKR